MVKAIWNGVIIAESDQTEVVEGNHYFPPHTLHQEYFQPSAKTTICSWKGTASYYDVVVAGQRNPEAAWYYPHPKPAAQNIQGYVAFWRGVKVES
ncbi:MAG: DUF427 domain-containing protein [Ardenticatenaceae bacterium]|nr:DUF427 domain-containing protein [Ardenticatenaceae bacterium]MCB8987920.1 DUF427 domain-containing protein [Ardenticatenaceae bacterium]